MGNNSINERNYENARRNSVGYDKKTKYTKYVKIPVAHIKNAAMATLLAASIIAGGHIAPKLVEAKNDNAIVYEATEYGRELVFENTHRTDDKQHYFYDTYGIARKLIEDAENFDRNVYGVYKNIGYNKSNRLKQMNEVFSNVYVLTKNDQELAVNYYVDFNDYCVKKGFVKEDGTIDLDAYEKTLKEQIVKENEIKQMQEEISEFKKR